MTCRCTAQFCMLCGEKWKTCDCPWFNTNTNTDNAREREEDRFVVDDYRDNNGRRNLPPALGGAAAWHRPRFLVREFLIAGPRYPNELRMRTEWDDHDLAQHLQWLELGDLEDV